MLVDMIKPYEILSTRDEQDGSKTVFFEVSKTTMLNPSTASTEKMQTSIVIPPDVDVDEYLFADLQKSGWV